MCIMLIKSLDKRQQCLSQTMANKINPNILIILKKNLQEFLQLKNDLEMMKVTSEDKEKDK